MMQNFFKKLWGRPGRRDDGGAGFLHRSSDTLGYDWGAGASVLSGMEPAQVSSPALAMKIAAVFRCVDILSSSVAALPLELRRWDTAGGYYAPTWDELNYLLNVQANGRLNAYELKRQIIVNMMLLDGNAYIYPVRRGGEVRELLLMSPLSVNYDKYRNTYSVNDAVNHFTRSDIPARDMLHFRNMSPDGGYIGAPTVRYAARVLGITATADAQTSEVIGKGGQFKMLLANDDQASVRGFGKYQNKELDRLADQVEAILADGRDVISVPKDVKATVMSMTNADLQLLDNKKFGVLEICRFFGVHPDKVFAGQSTNYKASEMSQVGFLTDTLAPILRKIETEFDAKLVSREDYGRYRFQFDRSELYTTDLATESEYYAKMLAAGAMTVNEIRRRKGFPPVEGGDRVLVSANLKGLEELAAGAGAPEAEAKPEKEEKTGDESDD